jgi:hypothetical protein
MIGSSNHIFGSNQIKSPGKGTSHVGGIHLLDVVASGRIEPLTCGFSVTDGRFNGFVDFN